MIQFVLERLFDYLFQQLIDSLAEDTHSANQHLPSYKNPTNEESSQSQSINDEAKQSQLPVSTEQLFAFEDKPCHIQVCYMDPERRKMVNYNMSIKRSMKVEDVKMMLHDQLNGLLGKSCRSLD